VNTLRIHIRTTSSIEFLRQQFLLPKLQSVLFIYSIFILTTALGIFFSCSLPFFLKVGSIIGFSFLDVMHTRYLCMSKMKNVFQIDKCASNDSNSSIEKRHRQFLGRRLGSQSYKGEEEPCK
jgi:hypothetical protein